MKRKWQRQTKLPATFKQESASASGFVNCPLCGKNVPFLVINAHIDAGCGSAKLSKRGPGASQHVQAAAGPQLANYLPDAAPPAELLGDALTQVVGANNPPSEDTIFHVTTVAEFPRSHELNSAAQNQFEQSPGALGTAALPDAPHADNVAPHGGAAANLGDTGGGKGDDCSRHVSNTEPAVASSQGMGKAMETACYEIGRELVTGSDAHGSTVNDEWAWLSSALQQPEAEPPRGPAPAPGKTKAGSPDQRSGAENVTATNFAVLGLVQPAQNAVQSDILVAQRGVAPPSPAVNASAAVEKGIDAAPAGPSVQLEQQPDAPQGAQTAQGPGPSRWWQPVRQAEARVRAAAEAPLAWARRPKQRARVALTDAELASAAPCELVRGALPQDLADGLLKTLVKDSEDWIRGTWYFFGKQHAAPRTSAYFDLSASLDPEDRSAPAGLSSSSSAARGTSEEGAMDVAPDVVLRPRPAALLEAAALVEWHVQQLQVS